MPRIRHILVFLFTFLLATAAFGQAGTTGSMSGTVTTDGAPLPGASVTISSPVLQGTRTATTSESGGYLFPALPPGAYTVVFELSGMQPVTRQVNVQLTQPARADAALRVSAITEAITVTATAPAVLETTGVTTNFTSELVSKLPIARNIRDTTLLAPGVNPNGVNRQITINGGPSYDNVFMVNGVVVNENLRGQPHNLFIEDAIHETSVMTTGISAEYGRFTGGVVSTLTKSGGNEIHRLLPRQLHQPEVDRHSRFSECSEADGRYQSGLRSDAWRPHHPRPSLVLRRRSQSRDFDCPLHAQDRHRLYERFRREAVRGQAHRTNHVEAQPHRLLSRRRQHRDQQRLPADSG